MSEEHMNKIQDKKAYMKEYMKNNPEKWLREKLCGECGHTYKARDKTHHMKSVKHAMGILQKENEELKKIIQSLQPTIKV